MTEGLATDVSGAGTPIFLLHGLTASRRYVVMGSKYLERNGFRTILYDARGHGQSQPASAPDRYSYSDLAADLGQQVERFADRQSCILAGASMGAHTIVRFALDHSDLVAGIVLITPAFDPERDSSRSVERYRRLAAGLRSAGIDGFVDTYDLKSVGEHYRATVETVIRQRLALHQDLSAVADALEVIPPSRPFESWSELNELDIPALIIGSHDAADPEHPLAVAQSYASALPQGELEVEREGMSPLAWQGGQLSRTIESFVRRRC